ncbi:MAG: hypothetical protein R2856_23375 [Caldilineaceae bacterium]
MGLLNGYTCLPNSCGSWRHAAPGRETYGNMATTPGQVSRRISVAPGHLPVDSRGHALDFAARTLAVSVDGASAVRAYGLDQAPTFQPSRSEKRMPYLAFLHFLAEAACLITHARTMQVTPQAWTWLQSTPSQRRRILWHGFEGTDVKIATPYDFPWLMPTPQGGLLLRSQLTTLSTHNYEPLPSFITAIQVQDRLGHSGGWRRRRTTRPAAHPAAPLDWDRRHCRTDHTSHAIGSRPAFDTHRRLAIGHRRLGRTARSLPSLPLSAAAVARLTRCTLRRMPIPITGACGGLHHLGAARFP